MSVVLMSAFGTKPCVYSNASFVGQKIACMEIRTASLLPPTKDSHLHTVRTTPGKRCVASRQVVIHWFILVEPVVNLANGIRV
jgi:hypothetical protein